MGGREEAIRLSISPPLLPSSPPTFLASYLPTCNKDAPRVLPLSPLWPVEAEVGLRGRSIGTHPPMERALSPIVQVPACRDHLGAEGPGGLPLDLAEVGGEAAPDQRFEPGLPLRAEDLDLEIPAAGRSPGVVGGGAPGVAAGVRSRHDRETASGRRGEGNDLGDRAEPFQDDERISSPLAGLGRSAGRGGGMAGEPMRGAPLPPPLGLEMPAAEMEGRVDEEVLTLDPWGAEIDGLGVTEEPGPFMIEGRDAVLDPPDLEGDREPAAVGSHAGTTGGRSQ